MKDMEDGTFVDKDAEWEEILANGGTRR